MNKEDEPKGRAKSLANLKSWKPGQSGNPKGTARIPDELRGVPSISRVTIRKRFEFMLHKPVEELAKLWKDNTITGLDRMIVGAILSGGKDHKAFNFLLDRTIGKIPDEIELSIKPKATVIKRPNGEEVLLDASVDEGENDGGGEP